MTYQESLDYLYQRLPMFHRVGAAALKYDLSNTLRLLEALGNPHKDLRCIHVAGTNGKGTSAHALSAILTSAGYKTGLFTSPHLKNFTERARIDGTEISREYVVNFVASNQQLLEEVKASFFEVTFAIAIKYFSDQHVDIAVIETGLGGRLDSTNVITPLVALITMIGWDHADLLGDSLEKIAGEKAGIIKPKVPIVIGADQPDLLHVFQTKAQELRAPLEAVPDTKVTQKTVSLHHVVVDMLGDESLTNLELDITASYFQKNLPGVLRTVNVLKTGGLNIQEKDIRKGLASVKRLSGLKGRWHLLSEHPYVIADISHNLPGLTELLAQVQQIKGGELHLVFGVVKDKSIEQILSLISTISAHFYWTQSSVPRSLLATDLAQQARSYGLAGGIYDNVNLAMEAAANSSKKDDLILICGSTFVVAEIEGL